MIPAIAAECGIFTFTVIMFVFIRMFATRPADRHAEYGRHAVPVWSRATVGDQMRALTVAPARIGQIYTARHIVRCHQAGREWRYA
jgi:hypothetical protein